MNSLVIEQFSKLVKKNENDLNSAIERKDSVTQKKESFRLRTNRRILAILKKYPEKITIENYKDMGNLGGIGKGTLEKLKQILEKGYIIELKDYKLEDDDKEKVLDELEGVINIGKSKALELYGLGVKSVKDLKKKVDTGELEVNDKILLGLKYYKNFQERIPRKHIDDVNEFLQDRMRYYNKKNKLSGSNKYILTICGSYRRENKTSGDIDVLITKCDVKTNSSNVDKHLPKIVEMLKKPWKGNNYEPLLVDNLTDITPTKYMGFAKYGDNLPLRIDIRFVPYDSYYTALLYFTGSGELNKVMRNIAKDKGYKLSEYGLYRLSDDKRVKVNSEKRVFEILGMEYLEPKFR